MGHDDELCNKRLSKDKFLIVGHLTANVTNNRIMLHARKISEPSTCELHRRNDVTHFIQKNSNRQEQEGSLGFKEIQEVTMCKINNYFSNNNSYCNLV